LLRHISSGDSLWIICLEDYNIPNSTDGLDLHLIIIGEI
jgi:hypothetical protein